jgi:small neutral amino acid transporter SnatA (MarC family)
MTRAVWRLLRGDLQGSIAMHPLAIPTIVATSLIALAMVRVTFVRGGPGGMVHDRLSRLAVLALAAIQIASLALWIARMLGAFGGPVPV